MVIGSYISVITLNVDGLNAPTKKHRLAVWMKTCACMHFHLPHLSTSPPRLYVIVCIIVFYIVRLTMFPLWLPIVIIFYLLSYCWL